MRNQLRDWYFDVSDDGYGVYKDFLESFYNFVRCPADSMETSGSNNLVLTGETFYGGRVSISGISLITKISNRIADANGAFDYGNRLIVLSSSGEEYRLNMAEMNSRFRHELNRGEKVIQIKYVASL